MALQRMGSTHFEIDPHRMADSLPKFLRTVTIQTTTQATESSAISPNFAGVYNKLI